MQCGIVGRRNESLVEDAHRFLGLLHLQQQLSLCHEHVGGEPRVRGAEVAQMLHGAVAIVLLAVQDACRAQLRLDGVRAFGHARVRARRLQEVALRFGETAEVVERLTAVVRLAAQIVEVALGVVDALLGHGEERERASRLGQAGVRREDLVQARFGFARPTRREQ